MNIDTNTFAIVMTVAAAVFAGLYLRSRMMAHFKKIEVEMDLSRSGMWQNIDRIEERMSALERKTSDCCKTENKSYYNSGT